ncbi:hypothetical protein DFQ13_103710 [Actinokineospora spheciospongiae]|nr:hypothetical protein DFQ13_103710 [Actinokineospora spheciospongiae]
MVSGPTIHDHIRAHLDPSGRGLLPGGAELPDEPTGGIRWASGARDARPVLGRFGAGPDAGELAGLVADALAGDPGYAALYEALTAGAAEPAGVAHLPAGPLHDLGVRLVTGARHREPVRFGLGLLGADDTELLLLIGRHEEFTGAAAATIEVTHADAEPALLRLADAVTGWGRIGVVERFGPGAGPGVRDWLLRGGFRNAVLDAYLAHRAATVGDLAAALSAPAVDGELLTAACDIVCALLDGGPAATIDDYADAPRALAALLTHLEAHPGELRHLVALARLDDYLADGGWPARYRRQWTIARHEALVRRVRDLLARPHWPALVTAGLTRPDTFHDARQAARALDVDTFPALLDHVRAGAGDWPLLMAETTADRLPGVLALAAAARLAPADLDTVVTALRAHPGHGVDLVLASLASPVGRNRAMAVRTLVGWGPAAWAEGIQSALRRAIDAEPDPALRESMAQLLTG